MRNAQEKTKRLEKLRSDEVLEELNTLFTKGVKFVEPSDLSGSLRGRQNLYNHLDMMLRDAEKTITLVTTHGGLNRKLEALMPSLEKAKKRGVKIRVAAPIDKNNLKVAKDFKKVADVKAVDGDPATFITETGTAGVTLQGGDTGYAFGSLTIEEII